MSLDMSITHTLGKAIAMKQIRIALLVSNIAIIGFQIIADKELVIKPREMTSQDLVFGKHMRESAKISTAIYMSARFGNVSVNSIDELKSAALNMAPYELHEDITMGMEETRGTLKRSGVSERFIPTSAEYYKPLNRVWVTGEKYVIVNGKAPKFYQWTFEFDLVLRNMRIYPERIVQYQGPAKDQLQIGEYLERRNSNG